MKFFLLLIVAVSPVFASAQDGRGKITVVINNAQTTSLENATVELRKTSDSSLVKTSISDKTGLAEFDKVRFDDYFVKVSMVNYTAQSSAPFRLSAEQSLVQVPKMTLPAGATLSAVTVTARKPFIQKLSDRIVVNVENSIVSAGSSAMDVMERAPGVTVDQNDIISLRGRSGVIIMIDGKPTPMTGADLANYLKGLPSSAIERIDIITNPSSKYDASGNSGIIDIRMKKDQRLGVNGTFTAGYGQGVYPKANIGSTFNYRNKKVNIFGNIGGNIGRYENTLDLYRIQKDTLYDQKSVMHSRDKSINVKRIKLMVRAVDLAGNESGIGGLRARGVRDNLQKPIFLKY